MLTSITSLGERGRDTHWSVSVSAFLIGSLAAGALAGAAAGAVGALLGVGALPGSLTAAILLVAALVGVSLDLRLAGARLPSVARQVNEDWLRSYRGWVYGLGFGFQLGLGVSTVVNSSAIYLAFLAALFSASPVAGALVGGAFGLFRWATLLASARVDDPDAVLALGDRLSRWEPRARSGAIAAQLVLALALAGALIR